MFSKVVTHFTSPPVKHESSVGIPASTWHVIFVFCLFLSAVQTDKQGHIYSVSISSMTNETTFLVWLLPFVYLLYILLNLSPTSYWVGYFLIIESWEFLVYADSSALSNMYLANIISQPVACLFILLTESCKKWTFLILKSNWSISSFMDYAFGALI